MIMVDPPHPATLDADALLAQCDVTRGRKSGPGGQHRNKVETAIVLRHRPSGVSGAASERRSQEANRRVALFRLRLNLAVDVRAPVDFLSVPSPLWRERLHNGRLSVNPRHDAFPAMLAEAMDLLEATGVDLARCTALLECTTSQLVKLVAKHRPALERINVLRARQGRSHLSAPG